jgi:hypothetical protein
MGIAQDWISPAHLDRANGELAILIDQYDRGLQRQAADL